MIGAVWVRGAGSMAARLLDDVGRFAVVGTAGPGGAGQADELSAEEAREYARRLRSLPVGQVLGDFLFSLINAAQVKLGRRDARLLIDVTAVAHEHARPYLPGASSPAARRSRP